MNHKLITLWMIVLIVGLPFNSGVLGQSSNDKTYYDTDGDSLFDDDEWFWDFGWDGEPNTGDEGESDDTLQVGEAFIDLDYIQPSILRCLTSKPESYCFEPRV